MARLDITSDGRRYTRKALVLTPVQILKIANTGAHIHSIPQRTALFTSVTLRHRRTKPFTRLDDSSQGLAEIHWRGSRCHFGSGVRQRGRLDATASRFKGTSTGPRSPPTSEV